MRPLALLSLAGLTNLGATSSSRGVTVGVTDAVAVEAAVGVGVTARVDVGSGVGASVTVGSVAPITTTGRVGVMSAAGAGGAADVGGALEEPQPVNSRARMMIAPKQNRARGPRDRRLR